ncbi:expressed unknown protein [Seminavis robusta]|uniref:Uncharacterized protein n=1 Tax=Seminavis robusta TaxID=568900 RepID=A0A9N8H412_9STRA|nr:expressed unknown protein [Seminavis robusta]|eukprot:Sro38_g023901.1  (159) ;mRNA; f:145834-146392
MDHTPSFSQTQASMAWPYFQMPNSRRSSNKQAMVAAILVPVRRRQKLHNLYNGYGPNGRIITVSQPKLWGTAPGRSGDWFHRRPPLVPSPAPRSLREMVYLKLHGELLGVFGGGGGGRTEEGRRRKLERWEVDRGPASFITQPQVVWRNSLQGLVLMC